MAEQNERAFQKQAAIFLNKKRVVAKTTKNKELRYVRNVGLGFKTPREAIEGTYIDKKCPFTGNVSIRGRILTGIVKSLKMRRTIVIRRDYLHFIKKYQRYEKRHKNLVAHMSPCFLDVALGDLVTVGQCRPLSKTIRFNVLKVSKSTSAKKSFDKF
ncbi:small ribosomal subunit protein uS17-like [Hydra vulgaris]|uniref:Small ribosomal subunit protein uS17 n=1 Tax=Hydra vulgaris TaxID=6087 RepID=A0ABM4BX46_HYDVU